MLTNRLLPGTSRRELIVAPSRRADVPADGTDANANSISGYGAVFFNANDPGTEYWLWSDVVERIMPGAFDRALREDDVRSFFNHDANFILGRTTAKTLSLSIDGVGLRYAVTPSESPIAQHALEAVKRGDVNGSSFMFEVGAATWVEQPNADGRTTWIRQITEVTPLYEVGPVCFPAYEASTSEASREGEAPAEPQRRSGPAADRWQDWYTRHVASARESFDLFVAKRTIERAREGQSRRQRARRAFELSHR